MGNPIAWSLNFTMYLKALQIYKTNTISNCFFAGGIAGMDGSAFSKAAQKKWTSRNKSKKKKIRDMLGDLQ